MNHPILVDPEAIVRLFDHLKNAPMIGVDTEFIRESTFFPVLELIQLSTADETWLVDVQAFHSRAELQGIADLLTHPKILKVIHAAQGDQECFYTHLGVVASPTLDTAIAASLCGLGDQIGLGKLLNAVLKVHLLKGQARARWSVRPLPEPLVVYAHADVEHLVALGAALLEQLSLLGRREWALELSAKWENTQLYQDDFEGMAVRLAQGHLLDAPAYSALRALVQWREKRVRALNLPRRWVLDDSVLVNLARVRPKDLKHLGTFRGLSSGELKQSGEVILALLHQAEQEIIEVPAVDVQRSTDLEASALEVLRCFIKLLAQEHQISARHLIDTSQLLNLLRASQGTVQDWVHSGILIESAAQLIGEELCSILNGKRGLILKNQKMEYEILS